MFTNFFKMFIQYKVFFIILCLTFKVNCLNKTEHCHCQLRVNARIVNGKVTKPNDFPWAVSLGPVPSITGWCIDKS